MNATEKAEEAKLKAEIAELKAAKVSLVLANNGCLARMTELREKLAAKEA